MISNPDITVHPLQFIQYNSVDDIRARAVRNTTFAQRSSQEVPAGFEPTIFQLVGRPPTIRPPVFDIYVQFMSLQSLLSSPDRAIYFKLFNVKSNDICLN